MGTHAPTGAGERAKDTAGEKGDGMEGDIIWGLEGDIIWASHAGSLLRVAKEHGRLSTPSEVLGDRVVNELRMASEAAVRARKDWKGFLDLIGQEGTERGDPAPGTTSAVDPPTAGDGDLTLDDLLDDPGYMNPADPRYGIRRPGPGVVERFEEVRRQRERELIENTSAMPIADPTNLREIRAQRRRL